MSWGGAPLQTLTAQAIDEYLEENAALLRAAASAQQKGNVRAALSYSLRLQQNLLYIGMHAERFAEPGPPREFAGSSAPGGSPMPPSTCGPNAAALPATSAAPSPG